jgi:hypothetical protein
MCSCSTNKQGHTENPILAENTLPGSTDWLIQVEEGYCDPPEHKYCRRPQIEAYCSHTSIQNGDTLTLFVSTNPVVDFNIDIYRMGYYQGKGGNLKTRIGPLQGILQKDPDPDPQSNFFECQWDTSYQLVIPDDWISGVYLGKLTTVNDNYQSYIIFIVKDDRKADFIFQCSDNTWQAYNRWPYWHSMYDEGHNPWINTNGARISFDRPYALYVNETLSDFNPISNGSGEFLLWEHPLSYWMEQQGYDVTYISNIDTHADSTEILRGKAFLSVGHDEYWTHEMFKNVSQARDKGVNLLFLSGNTMDGVVYLDPSTDNRPYRVTGRLPERFFDNEHELMGATSYWAGYGDFVCQEPSHWIFEGTGMQKGDSIENLIGWEFQGRPLGNQKDLVVLAESTVDDVLQYQKDEQFHLSYPANHVATMYTTDMGNFVFNAGTIWWVQLLAKTPAYQHPKLNTPAENIFIDFSIPDHRVQQMTSNLFNKVLE